MVTLKTQSQLWNFVKRMEKKYRKLNRRTCLSGHPRTSKTTHSWNGDCLVRDAHGSICGDPNHKGIKHEVFVSLEKGKTRVILFTEEYMSGEDYMPRYAEVLAIY